MKIERLGSALATVLVVACGGDGGGNANLGVDDSKAIQDLTTAEAIRICERLQDVLDIDVSQEQACTSYYAVTSEDEATCQAGADVCIASPAPDEEPDEPEECMDDAASREGCEATVGEFETCLDAQLDQLERYTSLTCADAGKFSVQNPAVCTKLETECPNLFAEEDGGGAGEASLRKLRILR